MDIEEYEMELVSYLSYKVQITFQQSVNSEKHPQTKCMIWQKSCMTLGMLFVCMFILGLTTIYETINWNKRPDHATFSLAKSMSFPIFRNADT